MYLEEITEQKSYGNLSIDNNEKDVVSLWCDEGEDPQVVMIERENLQLVIDNLSACLCFEDYKKVELIKQAIEHVTSLKFEQYNTNETKRKIVFIRQLFAYMVRKNTKFSLSKIGSLFSYEWMNKEKKTTQKGYNHCLIIHSVKVITDILACKANTLEKKQIQDVEYFFYKQYVKTEQKAEASQKV